MKKTSRYPLIYIILALVALYLINRRFSATTYQLTYSEFKQHLLLNHVVQVEIGTQITGEMLIPLAQKDAVPRQAIDNTKPKDLPVDEKFKFSAERVEDPELAATLDKFHVPYVGKQEGEFSLYLPFIMALGVVGIFLFLMMRQSGQG